MRQKLSKSQSRFYKHLSKIKSPVLIVCNDRDRVLYPNGFCMYSKHLKQSKMYDIRANRLMSKSCFVRGSVYDFANRWYKSGYAPKLEGVTLKKTLKEMKAWDRAGEYGNKIIIEAIIQL